MAAETGTRIATTDAVKQAADEYNKIGAEAAKAGLQPVLHDERFELSRLDDGRLSYKFYSTCSIRSWSSCNFRCRL